MYRFVFLAVLLFASLNFGCASRASVPKSQQLYAATQSAGTVEPQSDDERRLLSAVASIQEGQSETVGSLTVTVNRSYYSASGRDCKALVIQNGPQSTTEVYRTACQAENEWVFVPGVSAAPFN